MMCVSGSSLAEQLPRNLSSYHDSLRLSVQRVFTRTNQLRPEYERNQHESEMTLSKITALTRDGKCNSHPSQD